MNPLDRRTAHRSRHRAAAIAGALVVIVVVVDMIWEPVAIGVLVVSIVLGLVYLCYLVWALATGRVGIIHWAPTARRQRRLAGGAAAEQARLEKQRLDAAMSYGAYRPTAGRAQNRDRGEVSPQSDAPDL